MCCMLDFDIRIWLIRWLIVIIFCGLRTLRIAGFGASHSSSPGLFISFFFFLSSPFSLSAPPHSRSPSLSFSSSSSSFPSPRPHFPLGLPSRVPFSLSFFHLSLSLPLLLPPSLPLSFSLAANGGSRRHYNSSTSRHWHPFLSFYLFLSLSISLYLSFYISFSFYHLPSLLFYSLLTLSIFFLLFLLPIFPSPLYHFSILFLLNFPSRLCPR